MEKKVGMLINPPKARKQTLLESWLRKTLGNMMKMLDGQIDNIQSGQDCVNNTPIRKQMLMDIESDED